MKGKY